MVTYLMVDRLSEPELGHKWNEEKYLRHVPIQGCNGNFDVRRFPLPAWYIHSRRVFTISSRDPIDKKNRIETGCVFLWNATENIDSHFT